MDSDEDTPLPRWIDGDSLAPFCSVSLETIEVALELAELNASDVVYDLGCGDGRICIAAVKLYGCRAVGIEIEEEVVKKARRAVVEAGVEERVDIVHGDLLKASISGSTVIFLYLLPEYLGQVKDVLLPLYDKGNKIVSILFPIPWWTPARTEKQKAKVHLYLYQK